MKVPNKVFISYRQSKKDGFNDKVRAFSDRLVKEEGINCILDQYEKSYPEGFPKWMMHRIDEADYVLMICTEKYHEHVIGNGAIDEGRGVKWEGHLIWNLIYEAGSKNDKFIPILFENGKEEFIPLPVRTVIRYEVDTPEEYKKLLRRITNQPATPKPVLGKVKVRPPENTDINKTGHYQEWNIPQPNAFFTGRSDDLKKLTDGLEKNSISAITQSPQVLCGLGGVGKTQMAIEYANANRTKYTAGFWVAAETDAHINAGFAAIAKHLELPAAALPDQKLSVDAAKRWLNENKGWLLIFDNADIPALIKDFIPRVGNGHVILTSRESLPGEFDRLVINQIKLDKMSPGDAFDFLKTRTKRPSPDYEESLAIVELADKLGCLPLALEQACAYIVENEAPFKKYLDKYKTDGLKLLEEVGPVIGDHPESVVTTWAINFAVVEKNHPASIDVLKLSAFLNADDIPYEIFVRGAEEIGGSLYAALKGKNDDKLAINKILTPLARYSLIERDVKNETFNIHRLVQDVLRLRMGEDKKRAWAERAIKALNAAFPDGDFDYLQWGKCKSLIGHVTVCKDYVDKFNLEIEAAGRLFNNAGYYLRECARFAAALPFSKRSLEIREKILETEHSDVAATNVAASLNNLAWLLHDQGQYAITEPHFKRALAIREKVLGPEHPDVAMSLNNLAALYDSQGQYDAAEPLYKRSLAIREKVPGPEHPDVATSLNNLAELYRAQGQYSAAEPLFKRALAIREKVLGPEHPNVANSLNNLAGLYDSQGQYSAAEPLYKRSLAIWEKVHGPEHPDVAMSLNNLATLYGEQKRYVTAKPLLERALAIWEKSLGPNHPTVADALESYSNLLLKTNSPRKAAEMKKRAATIRRKHAAQNPR
jgi:tetratricopeptide (TPR) repeat protein